MKIVSWNCGGWSSGGFTIVKYEEMMRHEPNILVIQECTEDEFHTVCKECGLKSENSNYYRDDVEESLKGIAVFSPEAKIVRDENLFNRAYRYVVPYRVSIDKYDLTLFAVWVKPVEKEYHKPFYEAIKHYKDRNSLDGNTIIIGDFNTFAKDVNGYLTKLEDDNLKPMINCARLDNEKQLVPTYFDGIRHEKENFGTDDFCFISEDIKIRFNITFDVPGTWDSGKNKNHRWNGLSDHAPIIVEFKLR